MLPENARKYLEEYEKYLREQKLINYFLKGDSEKENAEKGIEKTLRKW